MLQGNFLFCIDQDYSYQIIDGVLIEYWDFLYSDGHTEQLTKRTRSHHDVDG